MPLTDTGSKLPCRGLLPGDPPLVYTLFGLRHRKGSFVIHLRLRALVGLALLLAVACSRGGTDPKEVGNPMPEQSTREVIAENASRILAVPGVTGMMEGTLDGKECIRILVVEETEELRKSLPRTLGGYPVILYESGEIGLHGEDEN